MNSAGEVLVLRHDEHVSIGSIDAILRRQRLAWRYVDLYEYTPDELPLDAAAGLVILGGSMSVNDTEQHAFLTRELPWIRQSIECGLPTLGICLGAQLMAKALGQSVGRNPRKEIGFFNLSLLPAADDDELFAGSEAVETVFHWHGDTYALPPQATLLASTPRCRNQAFRVGRRAWGLQFHAEMTAELIDSWLGAPQCKAELASLDYIEPMAIRRDINTRLPVMEAFCHRLLGRFAAMCASGRMAN